MLDEGSSTIYSSYIFSLVQLDIFLYLGQFFVLDPEFS